MASLMSQDCGVDKLVKSTGFDSVACRFEPYHRNRLGVQLAEQHDVDCLKLTRRKALFASRPMVGSAAANLGSSPSLQIG